MLTELVGVVIGEFEDHDHSIVVSDKAVGACIPKESRWTKKGAVSDEFDRSIIISETAVAEANI